MANQEHLDILKQGVEVWNQWRQGNPKIKPDLRDAYLDGYDVESADKESYIFKDPDHDHLFGLIMIPFIFRANLIGANLNNTDLTNANLRCANFIDAGLSGACLCRAKLDSVDFTYANFTNAEGCMKKL